MYQNLKRHIKEVVNVSESDFNLFISKTKRLQLEKNETWKSEGKISQELAFVNSGLLRHFYIDNGDEKTEKSYQEGSWFGDFGSFSSNTPSLRNYVAIEKSELFVLSFSEIQNLLPKIPVMEIFGRLNAEKLLLEQMNRNRSFLMDDAKTRYAKFKLDFPELQQRIPQYIIAQFLSIKPETLSRIRKKLIDIGQ